MIAVRKRGDHSTPFSFNPSAGTRLDPGDEIIVLGKPEQVEGLRQYLAP